MQKSRSCASFFSLASFHEINAPTDIFYGLNAVRLLSVIALLLVFSSSIVVMVKNVQAFNEFQATMGSDEADDMEDCDYIECVFLSVDNDWVVANYNTSQWKHDPQPGSRRILGYSLVASDHLSDHRTY